MSSHPSRTAGDSESDLDGAAAATSESNPAVVEGLLGDSVRGPWHADLPVPRDDTLETFYRDAGSSARVRPCWGPDPELTARIHRYQQPFQRFHPDKGSTGSPSDRFYAGQNTTRPDRLLRPRVRDMIAEIMLSESDPFDALDSLDGCREQCAAAGVPFSELLEMDIDAYGAPPLVVEILRAQWADPDEEMAPPLLTYILEHSDQRTVARHVRRAAMARGENDVFQRLRHYIPEDALGRGTVPLYDGEVTEEPGGKGFVLRVQVDGFPAMLRDAVSASPIGDLGSSTSGKAPVEPAGALEFLAAGRMWELRVGENSLALKLLQGEPTHVDARAVALMDDVHELLLPRAALHPLSAGGTHAVVCKPCFVPTSDASGPRGFADDDACGQLVLELHVALAPAAGGSATAKAKDSDEAKVPSALDGEDWETLETESSAGTETGWVKASWSGRDEEL